MIAQRRTASRTLSGIVSKCRNLSELQVLEKFAPVLLAIILGVAAFQKLLLLSRTDGGGEVMSTYLPKTLMLLRGQNPYSTQAWAAPYPPFLFVVIGGIVELTTLGTALGQEPISIVVRNVRLAGLAADLLVALMIFAALRAGGKSGLQSLLPPSIFLLLPSIGLTNYYWFHGDIFGYLLLAGSLLAFVKDRVQIGTILLACAVIFKLQPILSLPLIAVWIVRKRGLLQALPSLAPSISILLGGLVLPIVLPGYLNAVVGFNLSYEAGNGMSSFTLMNLFNGALSSLGVTLSSLYTNELWIVATTALFAIALGVVWTRARSLDAVDVVVLGLFAWLIPLRTLYPYYLTWAFIPLFFKGRIGQLIPLAIVFEAASNMALWSWNIPPNPFPEMNSVFGYLITSLAFAAWSILGSVFVLKEVRDRGLSSALTATRVSLR